MTEETTENDTNRSTSTAEDFLDAPCGCAFALGVLLGFALGHKGDGEPSLDEIEMLYREAKQDAVLAIDPQGGKRT